MYCSSCGSEMADGFRFCPKCGTPATAAQFSNSPPKAYPPLRRMRDDKKIAGVCSGFARYLGLDVTLVRILVVCFAFWGIGLIFYVACWIIMPLDPLLLPPPEAQVAGSPVRT